MYVVDTAVNYLTGLGNGESSSPALAVRTYSPFINMETSVQSRA